MSPSTRARGRPEADPAETPVAAAAQRGHRPSRIGSVTREHRPARRIEVTRTEPVRSAGIDTHGRPVGPTRRGGWTIAAVPGTFRAVLPECDCPSPAKGKWQAKSTGSSSSAVNARQSLLHCLDGWHPHQVEHLVYELRRSYGGRTRTEVVVTTAQPADQEERAS